MSHQSIFLRVGAAGATERNRCKSRNTPIVTPRHPPPRLAPNGNFFGFFIRSPDSPTTATSAHGAQGGRPIKCQKCSPQQRLTSRREARFHAFNRTTAGSSRSPMPIARPAAGMGDSDDSDIEFRPLVEDKGVRKSFDPHPAVLSRNQRERIRRLNDSLHGCINRIDESCGGRRRTRGVILASFAIIFDRQTVEADVPGSHHSFFNSDHGMAPESSAARRSSSSMKLGSSSDSRSGSGGNVSSSRWAKSIRSPSGKPSAASKILSGVSCIGQPFFHRVRKPASLYTIHHSLTVARGR